MDEFKLLVLSRQSWTSRDLAMSFCLTIIQR